MTESRQEQAKGLRRWVAGQEQAEQGCDQEIDRSSTRVMAITSGKGGVGKSNLTLNLGLALAKKGQRVIILDADLGLANINILLGAEPPQTLADVLEGHQSLRAILWRGPEGVQIIPGASGVARLAAADSTEIDHIIEGFRELDGESDWLLIDTGAGISPHVMSFVLASDEVLVVTSPEPTALADAYGLIKAIWESESRPNIRLVVNRAQGLDRAERMGRRLIELAGRMLQVEIGWAGLIQDDERVPQAISQQRPFVLAYPGTIASRDVEALATRLLNQPAVRSQGMAGFMDRVRSAFRHFGE